MHCWPDQYGPPGVKFHATLDGLSDSAGLVDLDTTDPAELIDVGTVCMYAAVLLEEAKTTARAR
jgi:hypothetical protein